MFVNQTDFNEIAEIIRLAMAPAFLLVATGGILQLFAGRLARVVDRERVLMREFHETQGSAHRRLVLELRGLDRRAAVVSFSIFMGVLGAITVGLLIAALFVMGLFRIDLAHIIAGGFVLAMVFLIIGLVCFAGEVQLAARNIRVEEDLLEWEEDIKKGRKGSPTRPRIFGKK